MSRKRSWWLWLVTPLPRLEPCFDSFGSLRKDGLTGTPGLFASTSFRFANILLESDAELLTSEPYLFATSMRTSETRQQQEKLIQVQSFKRSIDFELRAARRNVQHRTQPIPTTVDRYYPRGITVPNNSAYFLPILRGQVCGPTRCLVFSPNATLAVFPSYLKNLLLKPIRGEFSLSGVSWESLVSGGTTTELH